MSKYENEYRRLARNILSFSGLVSYAVFLIVFYYLLQILTICPTEPKYIGLIIAAAVSYAAAFLVLHKLSKSLLNMFYIRIKQKQRRSGRF
jgi:peptidoglycan/LPS O-acetylase OafA/YrhL